MNENGIGHSTLVVAIVITVLSSEFGTTLTLARLQAIQRGDRLFWMACRL